MLIFHLMFCGSSNEVCSYLCNDHFFFFFCKQKTAYEMRISDGSSDVCSSDLHVHVNLVGAPALRRGDVLAERREVGREDRWRKAEPHRLTSSEIASPGCTWYPPCGL